jgi:hypothetical protein
MHPPRRPDVRRARRTMLTLEPLEDRTLLSVAVVVPDAVPPPTAQSAPPQSDLTADGAGVPATAPSASAPTQTTDPGGEGTTPTTTGTSNSDSNIPTTGAAPADEDEDSESANEYGTQPTAENYPDSSGQTSPPSSGQPSSGPTAGPSANQNPPPGISGTSSYPTDASLSSGASPANTQSSGYYQTPTETDGDEADEYYPSSASVESFSQSTSGLGNLTTVLAAQVATALVKNVAVSPDRREAVAPPAVRQNEETSHPAAETTSVPPARSGESPVVSGTPVPAAPAAANSNPIPPPPGDLGPEAEDAVPVLPTAEADPVPPLRGLLLSLEGNLSFDLGAWDGQVRHLFDRLDALISREGDRSFWQRVAPWAVAAAATALVVELERRRSNKHAGPLDEAVWLPGENGIFWKNHG